MARILSISHGRTNLFGFSRYLTTSPSGNRPLRIRAAQNQPYWASIEADIQTHLKEAIPVRHPVSVFEPMHYLTFSAPRTSAPALCIAACELVGGDRDQAMAAAAAIHLMHAAAHAHQHLPLTDRPRPQPTFDHKFNPNIELLTGDGIMPFGLELLSESMISAQTSPDRVLRVIVEIARATGSRGVVDGQYREMDITESDGQEALIEYVCRKKEGELHACAAACGAILGGAAEEEIERLRRYGLYAGMAQGMLNGAGRNLKRVQQMVEKLRAFAMKEMESFKTANVDSYPSWFESQLHNA